MVSVESTRTSRESRKPGPRGSRALVSLGLAASLAAIGGCAQMIEEASRPQPSRELAAAPVSLPPWMSFDGGLSGARLTVPGSVSARPGTIPMRFVRPVAIAVHGATVTVADAALGRLFRFDATAGVPLIATLPGALAGERMRLDAMPDGSLLVIDTTGGEVLRMTAGGRPLAPLAAPGDLGRAVDVSVSALDGRIAIADGLQSQVIVFNPIGRAYQVFAVPVAGLRSIAIGARAIFVAAESCACVLEVSRDSGATRRVGAGAIGRPGALAVDRADRLYVAEPDAGRLSVVVDGQPVQRFALRALGVRAIADLKAVDGALYLVDPLAGRIEVRRIVPRGAGTVR